MKDGPGLTPHISIQSRTLLTRLTSITIAGLPDSFSFSEKQKSGKLLRRLKVLSQPV